MYSAERLSDIMELELILFGGLSSSRHDTYSRMDLRENYGARKPPIAKGRIIIYDFKKHEFVLPKKNKAESLDNKI